MILRFGGLIILLSLIIPFQWWHCHVVRVAARRVLSVLMFLARERLSRTTGTPRMSAPAPLRWFERAAFKGSTLFALNGRYNTQFKQEKE